GMINKKEGAPREGAPVEKITSNGLSTTSEIAASTITVIIGGPPTAKGRPRVTRRGITYTPAKTRRYEAHGRLAAQLAMDGKSPLTVPVRAEITVALLPPAPGPVSAVMPRCAARSGRRHGRMPTTM